MTNQKVSTRSSSLRIAVIGVGCIGSTFAFQLTQQGAHEATAVARPGSMRLQQLQRDGGVVNKKGELAPLLVTDTLDESIPYDLVLVTLQAHLVDAVLPGLQRSAAKRIQFMFINFDPERLQDAIGVNRCSFGMPFVQALLDKDGRLNAKIGAGGQKTKMNHQASVETFNAAGLPAVFEPDMLLWLRSHAPLGAAFESVCAAGMQRGGGASWDESLAIARGMQECFTMIERLGFRLYPVGKARLHSSPAWLVAAMFWGLSRITPFREVLATGVNECRALVDVLVENAMRASPPVSIDRIRAMRPASKRSP